MGTLMPIIAAIVDPFEGGMENQHCTLAYSDDKTPEELIETARSLTAGRSTFWATVSGTGNLGPDRVPILLLDSPEMAAMRKSVEWADTSQYKPWTLHTSVSYTPGASHGLAADVKRVRVSAIAVMDNSTGEQRKWEFPLAQTEHEAMVAALDARLDFYSKDQARVPAGNPGGGRFGGTGTSGGKKWTGVSALPDERNKPIPHVFIDGATDDDLWAAERGYPDMYEYLRTAVYAGDLPDGHKSVVTEMDLGSGISEIKGEIRNARNKRVGTFERRLIYKDGTLHAEHELLELHEEAQGHGIADAFNSRAVAAYQDMGVDRIDLDAGLNVGGYTWARQGFRLRPSHYQSNIGQLSELTFHGSKGEIPTAERRMNKAEMARVAEIMNAAEKGADIQPIHIASIGEGRKYKNSDGITTWAGKDLLLGSSWAGQYFFDRDHPITASATNLAHAELRPAFKTDLASKESQMTRIAHCGPIEAWGTLPFDPIEDTVELRSPGAKPRRVPFQQAIKHNSAYWVEG